MSFIGSPKSINEKGFRARPAIYPAQNLKMSKEYILSLEQDTHNGNRHDNKPEQNDF